MAEHSTPPDLFDSHHEGSLNSNDDFEKVDAPSMDTGFGLDRDEVAASGAYDANQDAEISTTTEPDISGEEEAEEDQYNIGASEADIQEPQINYVAEPGLIDLSIPQMSDDGFSAVQPSAPVPEINDPFGTFDSPPGDDPLEFFKQPISSNTTQQPFVSFNDPVNVPSQSDSDAFVETENSKSLDWLNEQASLGQSQSTVDETKGKER